jgi:hypothetical protein
LLAASVFALLWLVNIPYRHAYQPSHDDVTALADGLLLLPEAGWKTWFTLGHSQFFDTYPGWSLHQSAFARPVFQSLIYLTHFVFASDWAAYLVINYLTIAGVTAIAFALARRALGLGNGFATLTAVLVAFSPAVFESSVGVLGAASESLAAIMVGGAFLALMAQRHALCGVLLLLALFTKETTLWAPLAAAATVCLSPARLPRRNRIATALAMLLPLALWFGFRLAFYNGLGGTYATAGYASLGDFAKLMGWKLLHLHPLFVSQQLLSAASDWALADRIIRNGTALALLLIAIAWALDTVRALRSASTAASSQPTIDRAKLVTLWAVIGLGFYVALAVDSPRYAASAVLFAWPALVGAVARRRGWMFRVALAACFTLTLLRTAHFLATLNPPDASSDTAQFFRAIGTMNAALRAVPPAIRQVYVVSEDGLVPVRPDYLRAFLGTRAEIIRLADISWNCSAPSEVADYAHREEGGTVTIDLTLPSCARFFFFYAPIDAAALDLGVFRRGATIDYALPEARPLAAGDGERPTLELGQRMTVHIHPDGPARIIIEHGRAEGGLAWFDVP